MSGLTAVVMGMAIGLAGLSAWMFVELRRIDGTLDMHAEVLHGLLAKVDKLEGQGEE